MTPMTPADVCAYPIDVPTEPSNALTRARHTLEAQGLWTPAQQMGRCWAAACVALEITQRCNLDCTLCYLSETAESVHDLPLGEVYRRIDAIAHSYGPGTNVQITGGDPTLRRRDELLAIVRRVRERGLRPTLMTNGIRARRPLLEALVAAGLMDIAFHVDTTQQRKGYASEVALNAVRDSYLERVRGLPLSVMFNTTVHRDNVAELPDLVAYFVRRAKAIRTVSFQLQADTGRGVAGARDGALVNTEAVMAGIERGAGTRLSFDTSLPGHPRCTRYVQSAVVGGRVFDLFDDPAFIQRLMAHLPRLAWDRGSSWRMARTFAGWWLRHPRHWGPCLAWAGRKGWQMFGALLAARGRVTHLSFLLHNFMDAQGLERERIDACAFKVMTRDGPVSMCLHNARRDEFVLQPVAVGHPVRFWRPLTGEVQ
ncbi:MAG: radical SAM protein [Candidatus Competibacterales bacterium]